MPVLIKIIYQLFELCNFSKSGLFERAQVQMPISPGSVFDARELFRTFYQCDRKKIGRRKIFPNKSSRNFDVL